MAAEFDQYVIEMRASFERFRDEIARARYVMEKLTQQAFLTANEIRAQLNSGKLPILDNGMTLTLMQTGETFTFDPYRRMPDYEKPEGRPRPKARLA